MSASNQLVPHGGPPFVRSPRKESLPTPTSTGSDPSLTLLPPSTSAPRQLVSTKSDSRPAPA